jgi:hypothetical protein
LSGKQNYQLWPYFKLIQKSCIALYGIEQKITEVEDANQQRYVAKNSGFDEILFHKTLIND